MIRTLRFAGLIGLLLGAAAGSVMADAFSVTLNTSSLSGTTQEFVFQLTDGDGTINNTATLSNFSFGGGSALGSPDYMGSTGVSGTLSSGITIDDSSGATAIFTQQFTAGSSLSFVLNTTDIFASGTPDAIAMEICATDFSACYSDDPGGSGAMLMLNLTGGTPSPSDFILFGATDQSLPAPVVESYVAPSVPEIQINTASSAVLLLAGVVMVFRDRRKKVPEPEIV